MLSGHRPGLAPVETPAARASAIRQLVRLARRSSSFETMVGGPRPPTDGQAHLLMPTGQTLDAPDTSGAPLSGSSELHRHPCAVMSKYRVPLADGVAARGICDGPGRPRAGGSAGRGVSRDSSNGGLLDASPHHAARRVRRAEWWSVPPCAQQRHDGPCGASPACPTRYGARRAHRADLRLHGSPDILVLDTATFEDLGGRTSSSRPRPGNEVDAWATPSTQTFTGSRSRVAGAPRQRTCHGGESR